MSVFQLCGPSLSLFVNLEGGQAKPTPSQEPDGTLRLNRLLFQHKACWTAAYFFGGREGTLTVSKNSWGTGLVFSQRSLASLWYNFISETTFNRLCTRRLFARLLFPQKESPRPKRLSEIKPRTNSKNFRRFSLVVPLRKKDLREEMPSLVQWPSFPMQACPGNADHSDQVCLLNTIRNSDWAGVWENPNKGPTLGNYLWCKGVIGSKFRLSGS